MSINIKFRVPDDGVSVKVFVPPVMVMPDAVFVATVPTPPPDVA